MTDKKSGGREPPRVPSFFMVPRIVITSGLWAVMKGREQSIYGVLGSLANYQTRMCFPSMETICQMSGVYPSSSYAVINQLVQYGLIEKKRGGKNIGFRNIYHIPLDPKIKFNTTPQNTEVGQPDTTPQNTDKCHRDSLGRFDPSPQNTEVNTTPQNTETPPSVKHGEERELKRKRRKEKEKLSPTFSISKETIKTWISEKGETFVKTLLMGKGLTEDQAKILIKEITEEKKSEIRKDGKLKSIKEPGADSVKDWEKYKLDINHNIGIHEVRKSQIRGSVKREDYSREHLSGLFEKRTSAIQKIKDLKSVWDWGSERPESGGVH